MTFKGAFQSFQTSDSLCRHIWEEVGESQTYLTSAPAPSPQCCGVQESAAQVLPSTGNPLPVLIVCISSQPSLDLPVLLGCPFQGKSFLVAMGRQPGIWFFLGLCVQKAASATPTRYFSTWKRVQAEERPREWWQGQSQQCWEHPALAQGGDSWCLQLLCVPSGPTLALGTCGTCAPVPSGCSGSPACSRCCWLLAEDSPSSGSCSQAAADDSPPCSSFPGPFLPSPAGSGAPPSLGLPALCPCVPVPRGAALEQGFPRILAFLPLLMLFGSHPV